MTLSRGQRLRRIREQQGTEQQSVAAAIHKSKGWLSTLENDKGGKNADHLRSTLEALARHYGVLPEYFLVETPQAYMAAFVKANAGEIARRAAPADRLRYLLDELHRRWGEEFSTPVVAERLGVVPATLAEMLEGRLPATDLAVLEPLMALIGVSAETLNQPVGKAPEDPAVEALIREALASGIPVSALDLMIKAWLQGRPQ
jgi:transcriptional regulator with XRE-family HTH domain